MIGNDGGSEGLDDEYFSKRGSGVGATIMGRNMFGPIRGPWGDSEWTGWWGDEPPFRHPVFVLTHQPHAPIEMQGGTTFHFVDGGIEAALSAASEAAGDQDVLVGVRIPLIPDTQSGAFRTRAVGGRRWAADDGRHVSPRPTPSVTSVSNMIRTSLLANGSRGVS